MKTIMSLIDKATLWMTPRQFSKVLWAGFFLAIVSAAAAAVWYLNQPIFSKEDVALIVGSHAASIEYDVRHREPETMSVNALVWAYDGGKVTVDFGHDAELEKIFSRELSTSATYKLY